jgi:hypothetical protein
MAATTTRPENSISFIAGAAASPPRERAPAPAV